MGALCYYAVNLHQEVTLCAASCRTISPIGEKGGTEERIIIVTLSLTGNSCLPGCYVQKIKYQDAEHARRQTVAWAGDKDCVRNQDGAEYVALHKERKEEERTV